MALPKYKLKITTQYEAMRFLAPADFNSMLKEWGEKFQAAADIHSIAPPRIKLYTTQGIDTVSLGEWIVYDMASGFFTHETNTNFVAKYVAV